MDEQVSEEVIRKARKQYDCMACEWLDSMPRYELGEFLSYREARAFVRAREKKFKILKGEKYIHQTRKFEGQLYSFRAIPEIHEICLKYEIYQPI